MLILSNVKQLYDGTQPNRTAVHAGTDVHIDTATGRIKQVRPHDAALRVGESWQDEKTNPPVENPADHAPHRMLTNTLRSRPFAGANHDVRNGRATHGPQKPLEVVERHG